MLLQIRDGRGSGHAAWAADGEGRGGGRLRGGRPVGERERHGPAPLT